MKSKVVSDEDLLRRMILGDAQAFETLYDNRHASVYRYAFRMSGSATFAEDVTQDVFIALLHDAQQFDPTRGTVASYLFGMTRHRVLRRLERERTYQSITPGEDEETDAQQINFVADENPFRDFARQEMVDSVREAVLSLPPHYREVVVLCNLHEMSYEEAAALLDCPIGTVRSRLNRARTMLVEKLREHQQTKVNCQTAA